MKTYYFASVLLNDRQNLSVRSSSNPHVLVHMLQAPNVEHVKALWQYDVNSQNSCQNGMCATSLQD